MMEFNFGFSTEIH